MAVRVIYNQQAVFIMPKKGFSSFQDLGKHLGRAPAAKRPNRSDPERGFGWEEKRLKAQLLKARSDHNRRAETIQLSKLGTLYRKNGRFDEAIDYYQKVLELEKEDERRDPASVAKIKLWKIYTEILFPSFPRASECSP
uniref:Tetratricopeptide repeat-containing protein n=1 Tax=Candidatus Kentrum sp. FW TaxID=2126338 RepID=A0A450TPM7_9GAMM|nr:MAG: Tetratricopeptide repeat-containing protein [Candidatus Kentron sp. FW]